MLQSVSEQIFNMISWHCIRYVTLLLIAYDILLHGITNQVMGILRVVKNKDNRPFS